jgi:hypothetical protein
VTFGEVSATTKWRTEYHKKFQKSDTEDFADQNGGSNAIVQASELLEKTWY